MVQAGLQVDMSSTTSEGYKLYKTAVKTVKSYQNNVKNFKKNIWIRQLKNFKCPLNKKTRHCSKP